MNLLIIRVYISARQKIFDVAYFFAFNNNFHVWVVINDSLAASSARRKNTPVSVRDSYYSNKILLALRNGTSHCYNLCAGAAIEMIKIHARNHLSIRGQHGRANRVVQIFAIFRYNLGRSIDKFVYLFFVHKHIVQQKGYSV